MKNRDYIKEKKIDDVLITVAELGHCALCDMLGIREYCNKKPNMDCKETILRWMEENHGDIFPLGTIVEYETGNIFPTKCLGYYNGYIGENLHKICTYKKNVGKPEAGSSIPTDKIKKIY